MGVMLRNPLDDHLGYHLRRAAGAAMSTLAERLGEVRLTIVESSVLLLIDRNEGIFQSEIGRVLGMRRANIAPIVAGLEARGFVRRTSPEGRLVGLQTTEEGGAIAGQAEAIMLRNEQELERLLTDVAAATTRQNLELLWRAESEAKG